MIPKIIHYCWFGGNPIPKNLKNYIDGWKEKLSGYEIIEWNEKNFDIASSIQYVKEAYEAKKYAFVSDYVRLYALKEYGGVYLDTAVEIVKSFDDLLNNASLVTGFETKDSLITAFIACEKDEKHIAEFVESYKNRNFKIAENEYDLTPINTKFTELMSKYGLILNNMRQSLKDSVEIYPYDVFCGFDIENSHAKFTANTCTIHHFECSWKKSSFKIWFKYRVCVKILQKILGIERYDKLKAKLKTVNK